jgi:hypothetical protein
MSYLVVLTSTPLSVCAAACLLLLAVPDAARAADPPAAGNAAPVRIQSVVDRLRGELGIPEAVSVSVLDDVPLIVSVEAPGDGSEVFRLAFDGQFLASLTDDELDAAVAHELGHVWVFTHHPYLQTERLANQIAMRVVSRGSLAGVYRKLWERGGVKGDLQAFLGP